MKKQSDNITLDMPVDALKALYNAAVHYQDHILSIEPDDRGSQLEEDFDILIGLSEAFDQVIIERAAQDGIVVVMREIEKMLAGGQR